MDDELPRLQEEARLEAKAKAAAKKAAEEAAAKQQNATAVEDDVTVAESRELDLATWSELVGNPFKP